MSHGIPTPKNAQAFPLPSARPLSPSAVPSSWLAHIAKNVALILLSLMFLPLDSGLVLLGYGLGLVFSGTASRRRQARAPPGFYPRTILVTGVGMSKGLALARIFHEAGHDVIGADVWRHGVPGCGRVSRALRRYHRLPDPDTDPAAAAAYIQHLLTIVRREKVDLWVSCSGVDAAMEDGRAADVIERRTRCRAVQFGARRTATLHAKHSFIAYTQRLGLPVPETHHVTSRTAVHQILNHAPAGRRFILKHVGVDDASRADLTLLPRPSTSDTYQHVAGLEISRARPWVLQQFIGGREYCSHALVVAGVVKAFVACPSAELLMHYEPVPVRADAGIGRALLAFTRRFVARSPGAERMTGHLSFDFIVQPRETARGLALVVYPIECNPRAHTAVVLFGGDRVVRRRLADAYLSA
ncbi:MAG: hypothetical protein M1826_007643, partial [Phylliscum demangeonii]